MRAIDFDRLLKVCEKDLQSQKNTQKKDSSSYTKITSIDTVESCCPSLLPDFEGLLEIADGGYDRRKEQNMNKEKPSGVVEAQKDAPEKGEERISAGGEEDRSKVLNRYICKLSSLSPLTCSPKNNVIIGRRIV